MLRFKTLACTGLAAAVMGVGLTIFLNLDKTIVLPFFPDVADSAIIFAAGILLLREVLKDASKM